MNEGLEPKKNTGLIIKMPTPGAFVADQETGIAFEERLADGDWERYKPTDEWQRRFLNGILGYDTNSCVTFSALRCVEMQIEWMLDNGLIPAETIQLMRDLGYFDENGKVNFNEWFSANTNGTTANGNDLENVWAHIRHDGLLGQADGYKPNDFKTIDEWFDKTRLTQAHKDKALKFLDIFTVEYEWAINWELGAQDKYAKHVKQAPLHIATPTCGSWNADAGEIVTSCGSYKGLNHATTYLGGQIPGVSHKDLDHYNPFVKRLSWDYYMPIAMKGLISLKKAPPSVPPAFTYVFSRNLYYRATTNNLADMRALQTALQTLKRADGTPYMKAGVYGPYGPQTRTAVALFQQDHGIIDPQPGEHFGPQSRAAMNAALGRLTT